MAPDIQPVNPVRFFDPGVDDTVFYTYAIIACRNNGKWLWVRHKDRITWELPAGHIEPGESPLEAAKRELYEETGALEYQIDPVISYEGIYQGQPVFGRIFLALVQKLGPMPEFEIAERALFDGIPDKLTYPEIQPAFFNYIRRHMDENGFVDLTALPNIGISLAVNLVQAGITSPGKLMELGTEQTFQRIRTILPDACISHLYAIEGAIQGIRWHNIDTTRREELRSFYNQLNPSSF